MVYVCVWGAGSLGLFWVTPPMLELFLGTKVPQAPGVTLVGAPFLLLPFPLFSLRPKLP